MKSWSWWTQNCRIFFLLLWSVLFASRFLFELTLHELKYATFLIEAARRSFFHFRIKFCTFFSHDLLQSMIQTVLLKLICQILALSIWLFLCMTQSQLGTNLFLKSSLRYLIINFRFRDKSILPQVKFRFFAFFRAVLLLFLRWFLRWFLRFFLRWFLRWFLRFFLGFFLRFFLWGFLNRGRV